jgi:hypothetical protein
MPMLSFDSLPQARLVRKGGQLFTPPRAPRPRPAHDQLREQLRTVLAVAMGMWPLTGVLLLAMGLLWMAGMNSAP